MHSLRIADTWYAQAPQEERCAIDDVVMLAGSGGTIHALRRWMETGRFTVGLAAISPLVEDMHGVRDWLPAPLSMYVYRPPQEQVPEAMPWVHRALFAQIEEFRVLLGIMVAPNRGRSIPRIPQTKTEIREVIYARLERGETLIL